LFFATQCSVKEATCIQIKQGKSLKIRELNLIDETQTQSP